MSLVKPTKFAHVLYRTRRLEEMVSWYQTVFAAKVRYRNSAIAFLSYDDEHHRFAFVDLLTLQPDGSEADRQGMIGIDHVAYTYDSLNELLENYERLKEQGINPYWCIHHGVSASMYYGDPDGNQVEFQVDCFASTEAANVFMYSPHFDANPIGVEFDPEEWLDRIRAGVRASEFLIRRSNEPVSPLRGALASLLVEANNNQDREVM